MAHRDVSRVVRANTMITQVKMIRANMSVSFLLGCLFMLVDDYDRLRCAGDQPKRKRAEGEAHVK